MFNMMKTITEEIMDTLESFFQYEYEEILEHDATIYNGVKDILNKE